MLAGNADLIVEAATENQDLKLKIFQQMDELGRKLYSRYQYFIYFYY